MLSRATLPAGDATVDLSLSANISSLVTGVLIARSAAFGDDRDDFVPLANERARHVDRRGRVVDENGELGAERKLLERQLGANEGVGADFA